MKICLIIPPSPFLLDERVFPSLGVLRVAASLRSNGNDIELLDLSGISNYEEVAMMHAQQSSAIWFGLTATTPQMPAAKKIALAIRKARPSAHLVLGGPHPTLVWASVRAHQTARAWESMYQLEELFDTVVTGDGELAACIAMTNGHIDADDPKSQLFLTNGTYENLPIPARDLIDMSSYHYSIDGVPATSLIAQLGCPFNCGFCGGRESPMLRRVRTRSPKAILTELKHLYSEYGYRGFMFYDDELNVSPKIIPLMDGIAKLSESLGTTFHLRGFVKSELLTDDQAAAMYRAGFRWLLVGFESGSPRMLNNMNKKATVEDNDRCMDIARRHGLKVKALMSLGHPGESADTVEETRRWLLRVKPDDFDVTLITTYPGTPYYDQAVNTQPGIWTYTRSGTTDRLHSVDIDYSEVSDYYKGDPNGGYQAYVFTDYLSQERLIDLRNNVEGSVRETLGIPFNPGRAAQRYEHSMGQSSLPSSILKSSD